MRYSLFNNLSRSKLMNVIYHHPETKHISSKNELSSPFFPLELSTESFTETRENMKRKKKVSGNYTKQFVFVFFLQINLFIVFY